MSLCVKRDSLLKNGFILEPPDDSSQTWNLPVQILGTPPCRGGHSRQRAQFYGVTMSHPSPVDNLFAKTIVGLKFVDLDVKQVLKPVMFYYPASVVTILPCPP